MTLIRYHPHPSESVQGPGHGLHIPNPHHITQPFAFRSRALPSGFDRRAAVGCQQNRQAAACTRTRSHRHHMRAKYKQKVNRCDSYSDRATSILSVPKAKKASETAGH